MHLKFPIIDLFLFLFLEFPAKINKIHKVDEIKQKIFRLLKHFSNLFSTNWAIKISPTISIASIKMLKETLCEYLSIYSFVLYFLCLYIINISYFSFFREFFVNLSSSICSSLRLFYTSIKICKNVSNKSKRTISFYFLKYFSFPLRSNAPPKPPSNASTQVVCSINPVFPIHSGGLC